MLETLGIKKITIPLPFQLDHVHCFLMEGENGYRIMDTGLHNKVAQTVWEQALSKNRIETILLTHLHPDHCGYAGKLQKMNDAEVWMTEEDATDLQQLWTDEALPILERDYDQAAMPPDMKKGILNMLATFLPYVTPTPSVDHFLQEGQKIQLGKEEFEVIFTPGHARGLVCFFQPEKSLLLSTDHILPKITPNIAYWFYGEKNPLQSFENSLQKLKKLDAQYVVPSHGEPFYHANKRMDEIWQHHENRLTRTLEATKTDSTIFSVCQKLFTKELSMYDYQFAIGETIAHLEYLRAKKEIERELRGGVWIYFHKG